MRKGDKILFSDRFQTVYELLGAFSYMYTVSGEKGIERNRFIAGLPLREVDASPLLSLLETNNIIVGRGGKLHLGQEVFYSMTVWDLLIIAEPWLAQGALSANRGRDYMEMERFGRSQKLSMALCNT